MKRFLHIVILLIICCRVFAQYSSLSDMYIYSAYDEMLSGKYEKAIADLKDAEKWLSKDNLFEYAHHINDIGFIYAKIGRNETAEVKYRIALDIYGQIGRSYTLECAATSLNLGNLYVSIGRYDEAENLIMKSLEINRHFQYREEADTIVCLNSLGGLYKERGNYKDAIYCYQTALKNISNSNPQYCDITNNLVVLYLDILDMESAKKYAQNALNATQVVYGRLSLQYAISLSNMGDIFLESKDPESAVHYYIQSIDISKRINIENSAYLTTLSNLAVAYEYLGMTKEAEQAHLEVLSKGEKVWGLFHPYYINELSNTGMFYEWIGDLDKSLKYQKKAVICAEEVYNVEHLDVNTYRNNLATLYDVLGQYSESEKIYRLTFSASVDIVREQFQWMTESQRTHFWSSQSWYYQSCFPSHCKLAYSQIPHTSELAYNSALFEKGLLLNTSVLVQNSILNSGNKELIQQWYILKRNKELLNIVQAKGTLTQNAIDSIADICSQIESNLVNYSSKYKEQKLSSAISWQDIKNKLKPSEVTIEFLSFYYNIDHFTDTVLYSALLLRDTCSYPIMIPLFEEKEVQPLANAKTKGEFAPDKVYDYTANGKELTAKIWSKIMPYIKPGETVYFAPSGLLHQLAIEALPYDSTHTMADVYSLVRLSSTREIVMHKNDNHYTTATLYGGIQYDVNADTLLAESRRYAQDELLASRGIEDDTLDRGNIKYLAWTKTEVEDISNLLQKNKLQVHLFTSTSANEESFKALSGKHQNILHIATHGFFWTDSTAQKKDYFTQRMMPLGNDRPTPPSIDPLNRCGLLFAGAQTAWSGHSADLTDGVQDGVLTAKEISLLDLRDADLVVLSACETAKGEITSDGVFGLQRAFKQAGAQTIIMSLWPVNDASTQLLMTEFYRNWITYHQSKREAFRNAQNTVRAKYEEPYYWAGFIMLD